jgi:hypothetical protein
MQKRLGVLLVGCLILGLAATAEAGQKSRQILVLGAAGFINGPAMAAATGAEVITRLDGQKLQEIALVVLANTAFASLPDAVAQGLEEYVAGGGALWLTGGSQAFGSGGYQPVASLLPFTLRSDKDWRSVPFRNPVAIQAGHPILQGVTFISVGALNDLTPKPGAVEILQYSGGGSYPYPLITEASVGTGRVIGVAVDLNDLSGMRDRDRFVENTLKYLLGASRRGL